MTDVQPSYLIDTSGKTVEVPKEDTGQYLGLGYLPATEKQADDYRKEVALRQKYETTGQQLKTFGEGAAQSLTLGASTYAEKALGVDPEDIKSRQEINPGLHTAGAITGVAAPLVATALTGGAAAPGLAGAVGDIAGASAPGLIARAGEAAAGLLPEAGEAATALGRVGLKAASGAVSAGTEGALYGAGQVVHEKALGDPNLTIGSALEEIGLSGLLGGAIGAGGGVLSGLMGEAAGGKIGEKVSDWLQNFEGNRNLKAAGGIQSDLTREAKKIGLKGVNQLGREMGDLGLVDTFSTPAVTLERSRNLMEEAGQKMGDILGAADASEDAAQPSAARVLARARNEILKPLEDNPLEAGAAKQLGDVLGAYEDKLGAGDPENKLAFKELHELRKQVSEKIYGLRGDQSVSNAFKDALHDFRGILSDEINTGLDSSGLGSGPWKEANREYQVAATAARFAEKGMARGTGNNLISPTELVGGLAGLVHSGPLGAAVVGPGIALARRFGSGALAAGSKALRGFIDEGAAESLVNKTSDLIAAERKAAAGTAAEIQAQALAHAVERVGEKLEPAVAPMKDALRDTLQERVTEKEATGAPETVAALSQLEAANQRVNERVSRLAKALVTGGKVAQSDLAELSSEAVRAAEEYERHMGNIHQLANNPDAMQQKVSQGTSDLQEHAPNVAQAYAVKASQAVQYLHQKFPAPVKNGPMGPKLRPTQDDIHRFNRTKEALDKPSVLLKHAAAGRLIPDQVAAVSAVFPERLMQMRQAVLSAAAEHKGTVPYKSRLSLSMLLGQSVDGTTTPQAIAANQLIYRLPSAKSGENQTGPAALGKTTQGGLAKLNVSKSAMLPGQAADVRTRTA